ncbi:hypothetical protein GQ44DRAFT_708559 [Phaeosphaeriaceae sp. PMI808]|nr:hypothetical protein GQ44DRAFT_708559 [Phaeosphaeriaceae sp. PMI808]
MKSRLIISGLTIACRHNVYVGGMRYASSASTLNSRTGSQYLRKAPPPLRPLQMQTTNAGKKVLASPPQAVVAKEGTDKLNPPSFTYAPELVVAPRQPKQNFFSYLWKAGRSYITFYKTGVKHVRQTRKVAQTLRQTAKRLAPRRDFAEVTTRATWQIIRRSRKDMLRLPAFGIIFLICGEWTPLLVLYMTPLVPEPCRIPSQVQRELSKTEDRRHMRQRRAGLGATAHHSASLNATQADFIRNANPLKLTVAELTAASARYDCHSRIWDWMFITPPKFLLQRNVRKKFKYLGTDDKLIEKFGGHCKLERREMERACIERGIDVLGKQEEELRRELAKYFK